MEKTLEDLESERFSWSLKTFPRATAESSLTKAEEELREVREAIQQSKNKNELIEEYVDLLMCVFDSAGRNDIYVRDLRDAYYKKLEINKNRKWKKNDDDTYSHIKEENNG